nr:dynamin family protein [Microbacterium lemovicicum]
MSRGASGEVGLLVDLARDVYADDATATDVLQAARARLREPLRLAVAGMVKAGKSTLLNALIGEQIAPTDAGECTRTVTWYRYAKTARVTAHLVGGGEVRLPVRRSAGALVLDLDGRTADDVSRIDVEWPSENLRGTVLIDTPGIASLSERVSARATRFLTPSDAPSEADAILYLLRHIHASDVSFLEAFHDTAAGAAQTVNAVALLSRADEIGAGRIDSLLSAARIAGRYRADGELRSIALECIPVAGLLAEAARTLRENEFAALRELADLDRSTRDRMLISVDRFTRPTTDCSLSPAQRRALLARFGIFGIRLATALIRGGARTSSELSERLVQQSGLVDVQRFVAEQFRARAGALKARTILDTLERLIRDRPRPGTASVHAGIERIRSSSHDLRELDLLALLRTGGPTLLPEDAVEAERIIGGAGTASLSRLGLGESARPSDVDDRVRSLLGHWRALSESPLSDRRTVETCHVVIRSLEGVAAQRAFDGTSRSDDDGPAVPESDAGAGGRGDGTPADVVLAGGPGKSGR